MFRKGDLVRAKPGMYDGFTPGSQYNLPRTVGVVDYSGPGALTIKYDGKISPPVNPDCFFKVGEYPMSRDEKVKSLEEENDILWDFIDKLRSLRNKARTGGPSS